MGLKDSFSKFLRTDEIKYALIGLIEAKLELKKLEVQEILGEQLTNLVYALVLLLIGLMVLFFVSILIASGLNSWLGSVWYGYAIVGVIYVCLLIFWISQELTIKRKIREITEKQLDEQFDKVKFYK